MHTLIIKAHPRASGFSHRIAETYKNKQEQLGNTVEILELTQAENIQSFPVFADENHLVEDETTKRMQEKITQADELVFIFPVWWFDAPAIMKNWIDRNFTSGFAFRYRPDGKWWDKLLSGKTAKVFATAWGPGWLIGFFMGLIWKLGRFGFVGLKSTAFKVLGNFPKLTEVQKQAFLNTL
jgi:NAD(P)H dehydrogenase (quinone)